jgi:acetyl esterase/lipase
MAAPQSSGVSLTGGASAPLDPVLADIGRRWKTMGIPDLYDGCLSAPHGGEVCRERGRNVRAFFYPKPELPAGHIEHITIDGMAFGVDAQIPARIVWPHASCVAQLKDGKPTSTLVYFHGGGWVVGDLDSHEAHAIRLANEAQCVVLNVDYRLAPEHRFPAAYNDAMAATRWAHAHIARLGGNLARLAVGGDSAGGNLAAAVAVGCKEAGMVLAAQLLVYPATNLGQLKGTPEQAYLGEDADVRSLDPRASPYHAASHAGLAPAILGVGPHDFLYKDNVAYADRLRQAQVPLTYREFPTLNHGFFSYTAISNDSLAAAQLLCQDLRAHFERA